MSDGLGRGILLLEGVRDFCDQFCYINQVFFIHNEVYISATLTLIIPPKSWVGKRPAQAFQIHKLYIIQIVLDLPNFLTEYGACVQKNITNKIIPVRNQFSC